jgi:hypothetical protein
MDVAILQQEIQRLPEHLQDRLAAFLTALRMHRSGQDQEIFSRLDDHRPEKWSSWQQVKLDMGKDDLPAE